MMCRNSCIAGAERNRPVVGCSINAAEYELNSVLPNKDSMSNIDNLSCRLSRIDMAGK